MKLALLTSAICCTLLAFTRPASAQQPMVFTTTPLQANGDRFFESTNMSWSLRGPNFFATFGGPNVGIPRFGGYNPNAGLSSGWAFNSGKFSGNFRFNFSQGYERFSTTTAPSLTTLDGHTGQFFSGVRRPFVYSLVPVVPPGGAFFSTPTPSFHRQYRLPSNLAERVLRGDVILPESRSTAQSGTASSGKPSTMTVSDPAAARKNAAFAWFSDKAKTHDSASNSHAKTDNVVLAPTAKPAEEPLENQAALVAQQAGSADSEVAPKAEPKPQAAHSQRIAEVYFQRGLDAETGNNSTKATFLYRVAAERASGELKTRIDRQLRSLTHD